MQEAAAKYQGEGFTRIYIACAGRDTQKLIDLLETMFGNMDEPELQEFEGSVTRALRAEAAAAEEASVAKEEGSIPADKVTRIIIRSLPVPPEIGIPPQSLPETECVKERSKKNPAKKVSRYYYNCKICMDHSSQNKVSMMTHTRRCLNIKLVCGLCDKEYESHDHIDNHITQVHNGQCAPLPPSSSSSKVQ